MATGVTLMTVTKEIGDGRARDQRRDGSARDGLVQGLHLLAPTINVLAYPHIARAWPMDDSDLTLTFTVGGVAVPYMHGLVYPAVSTVAGQPATAFPVGRLREGLPVGLQAIGPYRKDRTPIRSAALLAREIGGFEKPAGYDEG